MQMFILPPGHVHLWAAQPEQCQQPALLALYRRLLDETETAEGLRFRVEKKRREHLLARALLRTVLSRYAPVQPEQWRFRRSVAGKPSIDWAQVRSAGIQTPANPLGWHVPAQPEGPAEDSSPLLSPGGQMPAEIPGASHSARPEGPPGDRLQMLPSGGQMPAHMPALEFNLSHTEGMILCAVTAGCPIGVDVEDSFRTAECLPLARRFFHPTETALLENLPADQLLLAFYRLWTLKEAYLKALGAGLTGSLDAFGFRWPTGQMAPPRLVRLPPAAETLVLPPMEADAPELVSFSSAPGGQPGCWQFREFLLEGRFLVALAVAHPPEKPLHITLQQTIPLADRW